MADFNPDEFKTNNGNNINPLLNQPTKSTVNPLAGHFRTAKIYFTLPSGGKYYGENCLEMSETGELPVLPMTAKDELALKTPDALLSGQATVDLIQSCIPNIKNAWSMPSLDIDACLIAIRIATYGEHMSISATAPGTTTQVDYTIDLRNVLDRYTNAEFDNKFDANGLTCIVRPLSYKEFSQVSMQTFEEQRIFSLVNNDQIEEDEKLKQFNITFNKIRDITLGMVINSVVSIQVGDDVVTARDHITEFLENTDKSFFKALSDHIEVQKKTFEVPPMKVKATEEQIAEGSAENFEVPIIFDQSTFFA
jgi:hypothetical protein|tara:strand:+ start:3475 stop:4398 length:924 start_codon:yes stop_codon:yes gene_type:complete